MKKTLQTPDKEITILSTEEFPMIAKTFQGLEEVLAEELTSIGASNVQIQRRAVSFTGDKALMYKANLHCRTALRILKPIFTFNANDADEVYEQIKKFDWGQLMTVESTFAIDATVFSEEYIKYFEGITGLTLKPIILDRVRETIFKGTYFQYNKVI